MIKIEKKQNKYFQLKLKQNNELNLFKKQVKSNRLRFNKKKKNLVWRFKNKKPIWRRKSQLWIKLFRSFIFSLKGFNRRFKNNEKMIWTELLKYRRLRWHFKNKIAVRKAASKYFYIKTKKLFLRIQKKVYLRTRALLRALQIFDGRFDLFVIRFGWVRTIKLARRMVCFGVFLINGVVSKKFYQLIKSGDSIGVNTNAFKIFLYFKNLRPKSIIKYKMYKQQIKKKRFKLLRKKKKKYFYYIKKKRLYRPSRSLRFRRTRFFWIKKKKYFHFTLTILKTINWRYFLRFQVQNCSAELLCFEKSKKFYYLIFLYNFYLLFHVVQYYHKPLFENIKLFNVLSNVRYN